jgi:hypothetical protein
MSSLGPYIEGQYWLATLDSRFDRGVFEDLIVSGFSATPGGEAGYSNADFDSLIYLAIDTPVDPPTTDVPRPTHPAEELPADQYDNVHSGRRRNRRGRNERPRQTKRPNERFLTAFRRELHKLLCSNDKDSEARRESILKESNVGQSSVALTIAAMIAPTLGTSAGVIAGAVAVALAVIGRVGLSAWCSTQSA